MAVRKVPYTDINATMRGIREQIIDSIDYCCQNMPRYRDPEQMFYALQGMTTYKNDPPQTELLQTVPTLLCNNYWGIPGAGDCDCFTILAVTMCLAQGWNDQEIILVGRSKLAPVHIYSVVYFDGKRYALDLTNKIFNVERKYKYSQALKV